MSGDEGEERESESAPTPGLGQHAYVGRLKPDPAAPAERVLMFEGLVGDSDRPGYRRVYFGRRLDSYVEFQVEDVLYTEAIAADERPLRGLSATRVAVRRHATVEFTRVRSPQQVDEFDLDVRLGGGAQLRKSIYVSRVGCFHTQYDQGLGNGVCWWTENSYTCGCADPGGEGGGGGPGTGYRTCQDSCIGTCNTECEQHTCAPTCPPTCQTCQTRCEQDTCNPTCVTCQTCQTQCGDTCAPTCVTCNPHVFTCGAGCL